MEFIEEIIAAHDPFTRWNRYHRLIASLSFGGLAFGMKFNNKGHVDRRYIISLDTPMVVIENFPQFGQQGVFTPDVVWIESLNGEKIRERQHPRPAMTRWPHTFFWDDLDLLYFAGYACWNYFNIPFLFASDKFRFQPLPDWEENGERLRRIEVLFPDELPTHCKRQVFYFDESNRIKRLDYDPEVFASWAKAAHYCLDYQSFDGICLPTRRRVVPRKADGSSLRNPVLVWIAVRELHLQ